MRRQRRQMQTAAPSAPAKDNGRFDPATWAGQARMLARNEAQATTMLAGVVLAALVALAALLMRHGGGMRWERVLPELAPVLAVGLVLLLVIYTISYARTLRRDSEAVRSATWRMEMELGQDLDGDGRVGKPQPVGHIVRINGAQPAEVVLPDLDPPRGAAPLAGFPVPPNDVLFVLSQAAERGVTFRAWDKVRLPSGVTVDRSVWGGVLDGLVAWQFAVATVDGANRRRVELRQDVGVDAMIHAVRIGAGETE